jgi:hypothetical protein
MTIPSGASLRSLGLAEVELSASGQLDCPAHGPPVEHRDNAIGEAKWAAEAGDVAAEGGRQRSGDRDGQEEAAEFEPRQISSHLALSSHIDA